MSFLSGIRKTIKQTTTTTKTKNDQQQKTKRITSDNFDVFAPADVFLIFSPGLQKTRIPGVSEPTETWFCESLCERMAVSRL